MKNKIFRASDFAHKVEYDPVEVEIVDLMDIADKYGHCDTGEVITVVDVDKDEVIGRIGWNSQYSEYRVARSL